MIAIAAAVCFLGALAFAGFVLWLKRTAPIVVRLEDTVEQRIAAIENAHKDLVGSVNTIKVAFGLDNRLRRTNVG